MRSVLITTWFLGALGGCWLDFDDSRANRSLSLPPPDGNQQPVLDAGIYPDADYPDADYPDADVEDGGPGFDCLYPDAEIIDGGVPDAAWWPDAPDPIDAGPWWPDAAEPIDGGGFGTDAPL